MVVYRIDAVTAWLARTLFHFSVPHISLVNLILEEPVSRALFTARPKPLLHLLPCLPYCISAFRIIQWPS